MSHPQTTTESDAVNNDEPRNPRMCRCGAVNSLQGCWDHAGQWQSRNSLMAEFGVPFEKMPAFIARFGYGVLEEPAVVTDGVCQRCAAKGGAE